MSAAGSSNDNENYVFNEDDLKANESFKNSNEDDDESASEGVDDGDKDIRNGRWTALEHKNFLIGLEKYGKEWKKISSIVPTRSLVQIRTHAQKHFLKVSKHTNSSTKSSTRRNTSIARDSDPLYDDTIPIKKSTRPKKTKNQGSNNHTVVNPHSFINSKTFHGLSVIDLLTETAAPSSVTLTPPKEWPSSMISMGIPFSLPRLVPPNLQEFNMLPNNNLSSFPYDPSNSISINPAFSQNFNINNNNVNSFSQMVADESLNKPISNNRMGSNMFSNMYSTSPLFGLSKTPISKDIEGDRGLNSLHLSVLNGDVSNTSKTLQEMKTGHHPSILIDGKDVHGFTPLMIACCIADPIISLSLVSMLLSYHASPVALDNEGFSPLHWACCVGHMNVVTTLLQAGSVLECVAFNGDTPLHRAARFGRIEVMTILIKNYTVTLNPRNKNHETPFDVCGLVHDHSSYDVQDRLRIRNQFLNLAPSLKTVVLYHDECKDYVMKEDEKVNVVVQSPDRIDSILYSLSTQGMFTPHEIILDTTFERANFNTLAYGHSKEYIKYVHDISKKERNDDKVTEKKVEEKKAEEKKDEVKKDAEKVDEENKEVLNKEEEKKEDEKMAVEEENASFSSATISTSTISLASLSISTASLCSARRAVGAVCKGIDNVVTGLNRNAFCCISPQGHSTGINGYTDSKDVKECGMSIFNNVAIGAVHALKQYPDVIKKVAVIDFDVHPGNGTIEILKTLDSSQTFFFSISLQQQQQQEEENNNNDNNNNNGYNTNHNNENVNTRNIEDYNHNTYDDNNNNNNSNNSNNDNNNNHNDNNNINIAILPTNNNTDNNNNNNNGRRGFQKNIESVLLPSLLNFKPDLILLSSGFDGAVNDAANKGMDLSTEDFRWITERIMTISNMVCDGRVVSVLEGGYGHFKHFLSPIDRSSLCMNIAAHVRGLIGGVPKVVCDYKEDLPVFTAPVINEKKRGNEVLEEGEEGALASGDLYQRPFTKKIRLNSDVKDKEVEMI